jgi:outer membrane protein assembly factor BamB
MVWKTLTDADSTGRRFIYTHPILTKDSLYFPTGEGQVYALNRESGEVRWKLRPSKSSQLYCVPATDGVRIFVTSRPDWDNKGVAGLFAIGPEDPRTSPGTDRE